MVGVQYIVVVINIIIRIYSSCNWAPYLHLAFLQSTFHTVPRVIYLKCKTVCIILLETLQWAPIIFMLALLINTLLYPRPLTCTLLCGPETKQDPGGSSWVQKPLPVPCFLFAGKRLQPPRPSLISKGQIQTVSI